MLLMGKFTISMAMFNSYVSLPEGTSYLQSPLLVGKHGEDAPVFHVISYPAYHQPTYIFWVLNHLKAFAGEIW